LYGSLLRRLTTDGMRRGMSGSTPWLVIAIVATGLRMLRRMARREDEILYRTVIRAGDVFEVVTRSKR